MAKGPSFRQSPFAARKGERGTAVVNRQKLPDGTSVVSHLIDLSNAPAPDRQYYARESWFEFDHDIVSVVFAQKSRVGDALRSMIVINMPPQSIRQWIRTVDGMSDPSLAEIVKSVGIKVEAINQLRGEADQTVELTANLASTSVSGYDVSIDFYKASPQSLVRLKAGKGLDLDPQVRIDMRTSQFCGLMDGLKKLAEKFPKQDAEE